MQYIQYSVDKKKLSAFVENNVHFTKMDRNAAMLLNECTKSGLKFKKSGECVDMCKAIKEIRQEEYEAGRIAGQEKGEEKGREEGRKEGLQILMKNMGISLEQAMDLWEIPENERSIYRKE